MWSDLFGTLSSDLTIAQHACECNCKRNGAPCRSSAIASLVVRQGGVRVGVSVGTKQYLLWVPLQPSAYYFCQGVGCQVERLSREIDEDIGSIRHRLGGEMERPTPMQQNEFRIAQRCIGAAPSSKRPGLARISLTPRR